MVTASAQQGTRTTPVIGWGIEQPEYDARVARVRRELERRDLSGLVLFHPIRMAYLSGFFHYSTERPMAIVVGPDGGLGGAGAAPGTGPHCGGTGCRAGCGLPRVSDRRREASPALPRRPAVGDGAERARGRGWAMTRTATSISTAMTVPLLTDIVADGSKRSRRATSSTGCARSRARRSWRSSTRAASGETWRTA